MVQASRGTGSVVAIVRLKVGLIDRFHGQRGRKRACRKDRAVEGKIGRRCDLHRSSRLVPDDLIVE
jgi:hypothetical protein